ncbi:carbohydrate ABC transporter permease [Paenibacillus arenilitoris]|uniref:Carbohydrate ABC transporter permease n=1 Tax=Paenibacillus arenilitoris TaxID=2772299 RepID=A0A927CSC6_9BACL|nr:carbohydrate ABC transporter permease [Paenibacillus arenilitoris]MBD2872302.1 carbohydrate ABC transporter permease [Paenibacillus arenilitoris]
MKNRTIGEIAAGYSNHILLTLAALTMILPFINVIAISFSMPWAVSANKVSFWPVDFTMESYNYLLSKSDLWRAMGVNVFVTVAGTAFSMLTTVMLAYSLSRPEFLIRKPVVLGIIFTMIFQPPMIPYFLTIKNLGLLDTVWAMIIPSGISAFNLIILRTFFIQLSGEIIEAAKIDGCSDFRAMWNIVMPLSKPALATVGLFYAVTYWNVFYHAVLFIRSSDLYPLQVKMREYISDTENIISGINQTGLPYNPDTLKMAVLVFATIPIIAVYPFLQKYFVHGMTIGSVKE